MDELTMALREAINDADGAAGSPDHLLDLQAVAAARAVAELGYVRPAGWEYAVRLDDQILELGFHTRDGAEAWIAGHVPGTVVEVTRRPVGVWENLPQHPLA